MTPLAIDEISELLVAAFGSGSVLERPTDRYPGMSLEDGYDIAHRVRDLRQQRGETPLGRKIGGTNPATYALSGATGPVWNFMYDSTVRDFAGGAGTFAFGNFRQSRIEPELVLHLATAPRAGMDESELLACIDKVAHGFEFVDSPYADWKVAGADATAAYGLHQALLVGPWHDITADRAGWGEKLKSMAVTLTGSNGETRHGVGANALGSPVFALRTMVDDIAAHPNWTPVAAGEIVTTGTLTDLMPIMRGETWTTIIDGAPLEGLTVTIV